MIMRLFVSLLAILAAIAHLTNQVKFDNQALLLVAIALLPWLAAFIESVAVGKDNFEIKLREIEKKADAAKDAALRGTGGKTLPAGAERNASVKAGSDSEDPQKGKWGGSSSNNGRLLTARVEKIPDESIFRRVVLRVESTDATKPLSGSVTFHLHPTFPNSIIDEPVINGIAEISVVAYGAFTVGAEADGGATQLEFDLVTLDDKKDQFFQR